MAPSQSGTESSAAASSQKYLASSTPGAESFCASGTPFSFAFSGAAGLGLPVHQAGFDV